MTRAAGGTLAFGLIALAALTFIYPNRFVSPGALTPGHASLRNECFACHSAWRGVNTSSCLGCHELARIGLRTNRLKHSFHQELIEQDCLACHISHQGYIFAPQVPVQFTHALVRAQARERCELCHVSPEDSLHRGLPGFCKQCHGTDHWTPASFEHDDFFVLDHDHDVTCSVCHASGDFRRYSCYGCHEHTAAAMRALHLDEGIRDIDPCVACHRSGEAN